MQQINVYFDESCHLLKDNSNVLGIGCLYCPVEYKKEIMYNIRAIKRKHNFSRDHEIKWTKVSKGKIQFDEIIFDKLIDKIENIIKVYDAEKIVSSCRGFDGRYDELTYYHIDDLYFIEYKNDEFGDENQNDEVKKELDRKGLILNK